MKENQVKICMPLYKNAHINDRMFMDNLIKCFDCMVQDLKILGILTFRAGK